MNRSALLVICDFLILTLLSFVNFDSPPSGATAPVTEPARTVAAPAMSNMLATLETALELEREQREALTNALASTSAQLAERLRALAEREQALTATERRLQQAEIEARRLAEERARLERSQGEAAASVRELQKAFETARDSTGSLQSALTDSVREAAAANARLSVIEEELTRRREDSRTMQERIFKLDETRERLSEEKQLLALELRETTVEARSVRQTVTNLSQQLVQAETEKTILLQTTSELATNVGSLKEESTAIREQSAAIREQIDRQIRLPANTIYSGFLSNRVRVDTAGLTRTGFGGETTRRRDASTVLVRRDDRVFVVLHIEAVALRIWPPDSPWTSLSAEVGRLDQRVKGQELALVRRDPRVVVIPIDETAAQALGVRIYDVSTDPAQFSEAVVIGGEEAYYGECGFHLSTDNPGYLEMERSTVRRLLGEFSPRRGDLALTKTGQFLGIMVNGNHCLPFHQAEFLPGLPLGEGLNPASTAALLRTAQATLDRLPGSLK